MAKLLQLGWNDEDGPVTVQMMVTRDEFGLLYALQGGDIRLSAYEEDPGEEDSDEDPEDDNLQREQSDGAAG